MPLEYKIVSYNGNGFVFSDGVTIRYNCSLVGAFKFYWRYLLPRFSKDV